MENNKNKNKAIDLIQKILAKATNNTSIEESEVAMLKAQEIMVKYGLTMKEIESTNERKEQKEVVNDSCFEGKRLIWWQKSLSKIICDNFKCVPIVYRRTINSINFIGMKEDVEIAKNVYLFAIEEIKYLSDSYIESCVSEANRDYTKTRKIYTKKDFNEEKNSYITGFLRGLKDKFEEQIKKNDWGLILVKDKAVTQYVNKMTLKTPSRSKFATSDDERHYSKGFSDGRNFSYRNDLIK